MVEKSFREKNAKKISTKLPIILLAAIFLYLDDSLAPEVFIAPLLDVPHAFDRRDTVVRDQNLREGVSDQNLREGVSDQKI